MISSRNSDACLDYANNRYYSNAYGRFMTPDRSWRSANLKNPQSWNRYSYVVGDPVNRNDPSGLCSYDDASTYYDDDDTGEYFAFDGDCADGQIGGDAPYGVNAADVDVQGGVLYVNGQPVSEASMQEDIGFELFISSGLQTLASVFGSSGALNAVATGTSIWSLNQFARGIAAGELLGANLPFGFPGIDAVTDGIATSIKSLNLDAASYQTTSGLQSTLMGYVNNLINFQGTLEEAGTIAYNGGSVSYSSITGWTLDIAIPGAPTAAQQAAITAATTYAADNGITLTTTIIQ